jgi:polyketide cyclase/dehydrase/lipid transport protein
MGEWSTTATHEGDAAPRAIWDAAYADAAAWPAWNPELAAAQLDGPLRTGATAKIRFRTGARLRFTVTECEPGRVFTDEARLPGARLAHRHLLEDLGDGRTRLTNTISIRGPLSAVWVRLAGRRAAAALPAGQRAAVALARGETTAAGPAATRRTA